MADDVKEVDFSKAAKAIGATPDITATLSRAESVRAPYVAQKQKLEREKAEADTETKIQELTARTGEAEKKFQALKEQRESIEKSPAYLAAEQSADALLKAGSFVPTKETAGDFAQVFALINIAGFALGAGGKKNAQAAMSGMNGMMEGYQKGRADLYKKERDQFLTNLKALENNYKVTRERLNDLIKRSDMSLAEKTAAAEVEALRSNADFLKKNIAKSGLASSIKTMDEIIGRLDGISDWVMQQQAKEASETRNYARQVALKKMEIAASQGNLYKDVRGQLSGLVSNFRMPTDDVSRLGPKEVSAVSNDLESAVLTQDLANDIKKHPYAAGVVGSFMNKLDKYLPSRYSTEDASVGVQILRNAADELKDSKLTEDQMAEARKIAKKAVDVINARALSASGGGRVLVSELNMQKGVIGLEGLSPQSAIATYEDLARRDVDKIKRYGVSPSYVDQFKSYLGGGAAPVAATPAAPAAMSAQDQEALKWANANPKDPRSAEIKKRLGVR